MKPVEEFSVSPKKEAGFDPERRRFGKLALAGGLAGAVMLADPKPGPAKMYANAPGIKLSVQVASDPTPEDLQFVRELGGEYVNIWTDAKTANLENYQRLMHNVESAGLKVWNIGNLSVHNMEEVTLNLPGRDEKIEEYKNYLRLLGKVGLRYTTYAHMGNGIWSSDRETTRGGASARALDLNKPCKGFWNGKEFNLPLTHGRVYSQEEIWENYRYFIKQVAPVAEEQGVRIGIHPDDPPVPVLGGVPRCIFGNFQGYVRALEIANSPNVGVCLCAGTWLEGGALMGKSVLEAIQYFGENKKLFKVHFRNVEAPLPHFVEAFVDSGYMDMYKVMRALRQVNFDGVVIGDHFPEMVGGQRASVAYTFGCMKAMKQRADAEFSA
jgi:mannonate dehydratase